MPFRIYDGNSFYSACITIQCKCFTKFLKYEHYGGSGNYSRKTRYYNGCMENLVEHDFVLHSAILGHLVVTHAAHERLMVHEL
jgi:hypothetical protein